MQHLELNKLVLIGASTGGPGEIKKIIQSLPILKNSSVIIAQHMADGFLESFVFELQKHTLNQVLLIEDNNSFEEGKIYLCKYNTTLNLNANSLKFKVEKLDDEGFNPNINTMFLSMIEIVDRVAILCAILTGIGDDGVKACKVLNSKGARCMTESNESAIIDGMPSRARELVPNIEVYDMNIIIDKISEFCE